jgi:hypothetical protein
VEILLAFARDVGGEDHRGRATESDHDSDACPWEAGLARKLETAPEVVVPHVVQPFREICRRAGVADKFCMKDLVETP